MVLRGWRGGLGGEKDPSLGYLAAANPPRGAKSAPGKVS